jgi:hypothetical protein
MPQSSIFQSLTWLFYDSPLKKSKGMPSTAVFSPSAAFSDEAWQTTTSPSGRPLKKTLVITPSFLRGNYSNRFHCFATLQRLRAEGFEIFFCLADEHGKNTMHSFQGLSAEFELLPQLSAFKEPEDYETMAEYCARDHLVIPNEVQCRDIEDCIIKVDYYVPHCNATSTGAALKLNFDSVAKIGIARTEEEVTAVLNDCRTSHEFLSCLKATPSLFLPAVIKNNSALIDKFAESFSLEDIPSHPEQFKLVLAKALEAKSKDWGNFSLSFLPKTLDKQQIIQFLNTNQNSYDLDTALRFINDRNNDPELASLILTKLGRPQLQADNDLQEYGRSDNIRLLALYLIAEPKEADLLLEKHKLDSEGALERLLSYRLDEHIAWQVVEQHKHLITNYFIAGPVSIACPNHRAQLKEIFAGGEIDDSTSLAYAIQTFPSDILTLLEQHANLVKGWETFILQINPYPDVFLALIKPFNKEEARNVSQEMSSIYENFSSNLYLSTLKNCPNEEVALHVITTALQKGADVQLDVIIEACPKQAAALIEQYGHQENDLKRVIDCLKQRPDLAEVLLKKTGHLIKNEKDLEQCINASPSCIKALLAIYPQPLSGKFKKYLYQKVAYDAPDLPQTDRDSLLSELKRLDRTTLEMIVTLTVDSPLNNFIQPLFQLMPMMPNLSCLFFPFNLGKARFEDLVTFIQTLPTTKRFLISLPKTLQNRFAELPKQHDYVINDRLLCHEMPKASAPKEVIEYKEELSAQPKQPKTENQPAPAEVRLPPQIVTEHKEEPKTTSPMSADRPAIPREKPAYKPKADELFVSKKSTISELPTTVRGQQTFTMQRAGKMINSVPGQAKPRLRSAAIYRDLDTLKETPKKPTICLSLNQINNLEEKEFEEQIDRFSQKNDKIYALFKQTIQCKSGEAVRLEFSIDAQEELVALQASDKMVGTLQVEKWDDGFYYVRPEKDSRFELDYIIAATPEASRDRSLIPQEITEITGPYENYRGAAMILPPMQPHETKRQWLERLYQQGYHGGCMYNVSLVLAEILRRYPQEKDNLQIVRIDNNHERLEYRVHKDGQPHWIAIDVGGGDADLEYTQENYAPPPVKLKPNTKPDRFSKVVRLQEVLQKFRIKTAPKKITSSAELLTELAAHPQGKILCATPRIEATAHFLIRDALQQKRAVYYINNLAAIDIGRRQILLDKSGLPQISLKSLLADFFKAAASAEGPIPLLIIDWESMSPQKRIQLLTLIDELRSLYGIAVTNRLQIVGLCKEIPQDGSQRSRYDRCLDASGFELPVLKQQDAAQAKEVTIDLAGVTNWEEKLFGKIVQTRQGLKWQKSEFVTRLESRLPLRLKIINASNPAAVNAYLRLAWAQQQFSYHGYHILWPLETSIDCDPAAFDFRAFPAVMTHTRVSYAQLPSAIHPVHTYRFDSLLIDKQIHEPEGSYEEIPGLIQRHAHQHLHLFISSPLTEAQWYSLFAEAKTHHVRLELDLAPRVNLPQGMAVASAETKYEVEAEEKSPGHELHVTNLADTLQKKYPNALVFHVEDYHIGDLLYRLDFQKKGVRFEPFVLIKSDVLKALIQGQDVVLRGAFSDELLAELQPLLLGQVLTLPNQEKITIKGRLICLVEPDPSLDLSAYAEPLLQQTMGETEQATFKKVSSDNPQQDLLHHLKIKGEPFIISMEGPTGAGKTEAIHQLKAQDSSIHFYHEFSGFKRWANDKSQTEKVLVIDESNMEDVDLMMFAKLFDDKTPKKILYQGTIYELDNYHKLIIIANPIEGYKGSRIEQKLLKDPRILHLQCSDLSFDNIEERILLPILKAKGIINDQERQDISAQLIQAYQTELSRAAASGRKTPFTVRELQELVLKIIQRNSVLQADQRSFKQRLDQVFNQMMMHAGDVLVSVIQTKELLRPKQILGFFMGLLATKPKSFVVTAGNTDLLADLYHFIAIRKTLKMEASDPNKKLLTRVGLNAFLLEGKPGTGKTALFAHVLKDAGFQLVKVPFDQDYPPAALVCYQIDASLPAEVQIYWILKAFTLGHGYLIDELDSCYPPLEKTLNAVQSGIHPETHEPSPNPGCFGLFSGNGPAFCGRDLIGPATRHRCEQRKTELFAKEDLRPIFAERYPEEAENDILDELADEFILLQAEEGLTLRDYKRHVDSRFAELKQAREEKAEGEPEHLLPPHQIKSILEIERQRECPEEKEDFECKLTADYCQNYRSKGIKLSEYMKRTHRRYEEIKEAEEMKEFKEELTMKPAQMMTSQGLFSSPRHSEVKKDGHDMKHTP